MEYNEMLAHMTPEIYQRLKQALELGKWADGRALTQAQKDSCMEAVLRYQAMHLPAEEHSGYIKDQCESSQQDAAQVIKIH
ncbi:MAG: YeaC family protein [Gammaproteobacteria bacterium]|jgi:hypothetical protein|nr:YeaC family protein [Gammaproteobacteria bacterium]MCP4881895.1 YeaC family protein [Gammaproteobacteria bacterium]MDP6165034.1 DUF1315 family protein [Gammaproteobacteria bacterium]